MKHGTNQVAQTELRSYAFCTLMVCDTYLHMYVARLGCLDVALGWGVQLVFVNVFYAGCLLAKCAVLWA